MTPELKGSIRNLLAALGGVGVTLGWFDAAQLDVVLNAGLELVGSGLVIGTIIWTIMAKRAASKEARLIAGKVRAAGVEPIVPPGPLDDKVKDAHL